MLDSSIARVIGPTPPGFGETQAATSYTSCATSPASLPSTRDTPTSSTAAPGLTMSPVMMPGTRDLAAHVRTADIVVAAAGVPGIITGAMVKPGAAVLDVGVSRVDGKLAGDVAQDVYDVAAWVSPNPGGVGPMTRAMLLSNIVSAAEQSLARG